jgi:MoaA/NifB/PqqE/SkfB family radical SAM enzyme
MAENDEITGRDKREIMTIPLIAYNLRDKASIRIHGMIYVFDIINACGLRCPSCPVGSEKRNGAIMSIELFKSIICHGLRYSKIRKLLLHSFSDPLLHPHLADFVEYANSKGIYTMLSTNLSQIQNLDEVLAAGLKDFCFGFSGWHPEYFQRGSKIERVLDNAEILSKIAKKYKTKVSIIWIRYKDNAHEEPRVYQLARSLGFEVIAVDAIFLTLDKIINKNYTQQDLELISHLPETPEQKCARVRGRQDCYQQNKFITLEATGKILLCCNFMEDQYILGNFLDQPVEYWRQVMKKSPVCRKCKSIGANKYFY